MSEFKDIQDELAEGGYICIAILAFVLVFAIMGASL